MQKDIIKNSPLKSLKKLLPYLKPYKKDIFTMIFFIVIVTITDTIYPLFNRYAINNFIGRGTLDGLFYFFCLFLLTLIINVTSEFMSFFISMKLEIKIASDLRVASFNHLQSLSFSYFNQNDVGYIHSRVMSDTRMIGELVSWYIFDFIWYILYLVASFTIMLTISVKLTLICLILFPIAAGIIIFFSQKLHSSNKELRELNSLITADYNEILSGAKEVKVLAAEDRMLKNFKQDTGRMKLKSIRTQLISTLSATVISLFSSSLVALILLQGGILSYEGVILIGSLSTFIVYVQNFIEPIQGLTRIFTFLVGSSVNIDRFSSLMETKSEVYDSEEVIKKYGTIFSPKKENWEQLIGDIEFSNVSFKYPDGDSYILKDFNLKVPSGTTVAIVGETGAGKSTLVNLVCRFFEPTIGKILIDGKDVKERSSLWLHSNLGYVLQSPYLFSGSIRDNLRYGNESISDEKIIQALKTVSAYGIIEKLENGLDSEVGEGGDLLSTGEKQLLSFTRAIIADPRILVLDEATSSIDTVTEKLIQNAISNLISGRTSFIIAHRLSTIINADVILVFKNGDIIERGSHEELMANRGYYHSLFTKQFQSK